MSSVVSEHFENNEAGENILTYYNKVNNVKHFSSMGFWCNRCISVSSGFYSSTDQTVKLTEPMTERDDVKNMTYQVTLKMVKHVILHITSYSLIRLLLQKLPAYKHLGNGIGVNTGATMPEVLVKDNEGSAIYSYSSTATVLVLRIKLQILIN